MAAEEFKDATLEFEGKTAILTSKLPNGRDDIDEHILELDTNASPKRITLYQPDDRTKGIQRGIYELRDDGLTFCMGAPDNPAFPEEFSSQPAFLLLNLKRK